MRFLKEKKADTTLRFDWLGFLALCLPLLPLLFLMRRSKTAPAQQRIAME